MTEILFQVDEDPEGGWTARAVGESIFTQGDTIEELRSNIKDAVECHFEDPGERPRIARLHYTRDEILAL